MREITYVTTLKTHLRGMIVGKPDQHLDQLVGEHYGAKNGYRSYTDPVYAPGVVGLIVTPPSQHISYRDHYLGIVRRLISTESRVLDWVLSIDQKPIGN